MPCPNAPRSQEPILSDPYDAQRELSCPVAEQGNALVERRTYYRENIPRAPPPSPTKSTPLICAEPDEGCPSTSCVLLLVDRKIQAHQARLSSIQHREPLGPYSPALSDSAFGMKVECSDEPMPTMIPQRQFSGASDDDDTTVTNSSCPSSRSSGINTLVNEISWDKEVDFHSAAIGVHYRRKITTATQSATQSSSPKSPTFSPFNLRSPRDAIADSLSRFRSPSRVNDASEPRLTVAGRQISSPAPIGSSAIADIAALSLENKQSKTKSWPGPYSQLPGPDIVSMPKAAPWSNSCASCRDRKARCDGGMFSYGKCLSRSETCPSNRYCSSLQPLKEHARGEEATGGQQATLMEEENSHFSDYSTDEDDAAEKVQSTVRLFNSLGRLNQKSKPRLSWSKVFSKP